MGSSGRRGRSRPTPGRSAPHPRSCVTERCRVSHGRSHRWTAAQIPGYIGATNVDIGSRVRKGDLLAQIEAPALDQKAAASNVATATLYSAEANLRQLRQLQSYEQVVAPFSGVMAS